MHFNKENMNSRESLSIGQLYRYYVDNEVFVEGQVVSNDGVTAIIKVTNRYGEGYFEIIYYKDMHQFFPSFRDSEAEALTEFLCLDVETERNLFFHDLDTGKLMQLCYDEKDGYTFIPADASKFRAERLKKKLIYELKEIEEADKSESGFRIIIDVQNATIEEMYQELNKIWGTDKQCLNYSLNRSVHWLNNRNCAIISAWRGNYNREENDKRNFELQKALRGYGFGVIRVKGCYPEIGKDVEKENSFLVIDLEDTPDFAERIYEQSEHYEQDCFLYKPIDEKTAYLIGTNDRFGKDRIDVAGILHINSLTAEQYSEAGSGRLSFEKEGLVQ